MFKLAPLKNKSLKNYNTSNIYKKTSYLGVIRIGIVIFAMLVQKHILPRTETEFNYVFLEQFNVFPRLDFIVVDERPVRGLQIYYVEPDLFADATVRALVRDQPVLKGCVLLRARRMVDGHVRDFPIPTQQISTLPVDIQRRKRRVSLKRVQSPSLLRHSGFRRFAILNHYSIERICVLSQFSRQSEIRLLQFSGRFLRLGLIALTAPFVFFFLFASSPPRITPACNEKKLLVISYRKHSKSPCTRKPTFQMALH